MYWCPHCEKLIERRNNILPQGVCNCGHPHLCECQKVESYEKKQCREISGFLEDSDLLVQADETAMNLASILSGTHMLEDRDLETLFGPLCPEPGREQLYVGTMTETLIGILKKKAILNINECFEILTPSKKEPAGIFKRRIIITLLYLLKNRGIITEKEFDKALESRARPGLDD